MDNDYYRNQVIFLKRSFERDNIIADIIPVTWRGLGNQRQDLAIDYGVLYEQIRPDFVFSINLSRSDLAGLPDNIGHISWVQDFVPATDIIKKNAAASGPELIYFCSQRMFSQLPSEVSGEAHRHILDRVKVLRFAADFDVFDRAEPEVSDCDVWVVASIETFSYYHRCVQVNDREVRLSDLWSDYLNNNRDNDLIFTPIDQVIPIRDAFLDRSGVDLASLELCDIDLLTFQIPRSIDRAVILAKLLQATNSVNIYGGEYWKTWERFAGYYRGPLRNPKNLADVYARGKLGFHNGSIIMHPRVIEAMASGACMLVNQDAQAEEFESALEQPQPFVHYIPYSKLNISDVVSEYVSNQEGRARIKNNARDLIRDNHDWKFTVKKIMHDVEELGWV